MTVKPMNVLIACEYSGVVRDAFTAKGHHAVSCDVLLTESAGPHYQCDVRHLLSHHYCWDLIIAHPPCTYLANAGLHYSKKDPDRMLKTIDALAFMKLIYNSPARMIAIENPVGYASTAWKKPDQIVNPFNFGVAERKQTCLWLKGLPKLIYTSDQGPPPPSKTIIRKTGFKAGQPYNYHWRQGKSAHDRSKTFQCIADAMANQWGYR